mmetsp:Transcript_20458/g.53297  ORF Transcript_20458/g.53297 Transcript_20458/m.53297 type:complete len:222 (-) Transcript_20458:21-686(-)
MICGGDGGGVGGWGGFGGSLPLIFVTSIAFGRPLKSTTAYSTVSPSPIASFKSAPCTKMSRPSPELMKPYFFLSTNQRQTPRWRPPGGVGAGGAFAAALGFAASFLASAAAAAASFFFWRVRWFGMLPAVVLGSGLLPASVPLVLGGLLLRSAVPRGLDGPYRGLSAPPCWRGLVFLVLGELLNAAWEQAGASSCAAELQGDALRAALSTCKAPQNVCNPP